MNAMQYSNEETVKAFKIFIKKVVHNAAIDYVRKIKSAKYREVYFSEFVEREVSLSEYDDNTSFSFNSVDEILTDNIDVKILKNINNREKEILMLFYVEKLSVKEIAQKLNTTENSIKATKSRCLRKLKSK